MALLNTATPVSFTGLSVDWLTDEELAYADALEYLESKDVYALAPMTQNVAVHQIAKTHVELMSTAAKGRERVLGAHMLEVCPSIAAGQPTLEIHPLGIGGKADPCRLVFDAAVGPAVNACLIDMGGRMRMIVNEVDAVEPKAMPRLPVARVLLKPRPDLARAAECWIIAGGAHHTGYSRVVKTEWMRDWAEMAGIEFLLIGAKTEPEELRKEIRWNEIGYRLGI